jgi:hypothetical protein
MTVSFRLPDLTLNPSAAINVQRMGQEGHALLIIDDVLSHPEDMKRYAIESGQFVPPAEGSYYPGRNAPLPAGYGVTLTTALRPLLSRIFGLPEDRRLSYDGFFGIATFSAQELQPLQCIPHFDSAYRGKVAGVHYFCEAPYQGTAFYRHMATGFESIGADRVETYRQHVDRELLDPQVQGGHVNLDMPFYDRIGYVEAAFNRLVVYSASVLHAGILADSQLGTGPEDGRLTANSFIEVYADAPGEQAPL